MLQPGKKGFESNKLNPTPRAGAKKTRSLSQVSVKDANKKKKLETFTAVPG
jgi:hypothetical protein